MPNTSKGQNSSNSQIIGLTQDIIESRKLFYKHLDKVLLKINFIKINKLKIIEITPKTLLNKLILPKVFQVFDSQDATEHNNHTSNNNSNQNINSISQSDTNLNNNINPKSLVLIELFLNKIENILSINHLNENKDFILSILNIIPKLEELINHYKNNNNNWRLIKKITLILGFDGIYRNNNTTFDLFVHKLFDLAKKIFLNDCFEIKIDSVKILAKLGKSKLIWDDLIKFIEGNILTNKNYYIRRLYLYFFEELMRNFSYKFLNEKGQIEKLMNLNNDNNQILSSFLKTIKLFYPLVTEDKMKGLLCNMLGAVRKRINNKEIIDREVIQVGNKLSLYIYH